MPGSTELPERRGLQHAVANHKKIFAGAFADVAVHVERDAFGVAVEDGFHLDELRVHVIRAGLGHRGQGVRRNARPGRNADVHSFTRVGAQILAPRIIADVDLDRAS